MSVVPEPLTRRAIVAFGKAHGATYERTDGRVGRRLMGKDMALLWTTGRKSGQRRRTALLCIPHDDDILVAASFYGAPHHPAWFLNLRADPTCVVRHGRAKFDAVARVAEPPERDDLWGVMTSQWPNYLSYQEGLDRQIPVVVLSQAKPGAEFPV